MKTTKNNQMPSFTAHLSRHAHDVSAGYTSSLAPGMIIPQYFDILMPGDKVYFSTHAFARLQDVVTAFLGQVDIHLDYFFVPLQMLYTPAGQVLQQTDDLISSVFENADFDHDRFPLLAVPRFGIVTDALGSSILINGARLLDAFNMNPYAVYNGVNVDANPQLANVRNNPPVAPWVPAAYQAIYQKYYRNDNMEHLDVSSYNFDQYYTSQTFENSKFFTLRYHQRYEDYFTSVKVSPIASNVNSFASVGTESIADMFGSVNRYLSPEGDNFSIISTGVDHQPATNTTIYQSLDDNQNFFSPANIRGLFAIEKYLRIWGRADKTYDDQILAHFGYKVPHDVKHDLTHIKHYKFSLQAEPVYSSASVDGGSTLGQVGGQGAQTLDSGQETFEAPVHGVFMCVAYALTRPRYLNTFSKLHMLTTPASFPSPEFDKLGMQPLYAFESSPYYLHTNAESTSQNLLSRAGWQYRYSEFKKKYNRTSLNYIHNWFDKSYDNVFSPWVLSRSPYLINDNGVFVTHNMVNASLLFESPRALDNVMVVKYDGSWKDEYVASPNLMFATDPIIFEYMCRCKKVSWMSETGEPEL